MTLNFSIPAQNIVCFDLLNTTWEETYAVILANDYSNSNIEFIQIKYDELHSDRRTPDSISKIYFEKDYIVSCVSLARHNLLQGIVYSMDYELREIKPILPGTLNSKKLIQCIFSKFNKSKKLNLNKINNEKLLNINNDFKTEPFYSFESEIINLEVKDELKLNLEEFSKIFNIKVVFEKHSLKLKTQRFRLVSIYYRNQLPIAFLFKYYGKTYIGWNEKYLLSILNIKPINLISLSNGEQLNRVLDKISVFGLTSLSDSEIKFLQSFSK